MPRASAVTVIDAEVDHQVITRFHRIQHVCPTRIVRRRGENAFSIRANRRAHIAFVQPGLYASTAYGIVADGDIAVEIGVELASPTARAGRSARLHRGIAR